jgi:hypothetical protein
LTENSARLLFLFGRSIVEVTTSNRTEQRALKNTIADADLILETSPELPQNRTKAVRDLS